MNDDPKWLGSSDSGTEPADPLADTREWTTGPAVDGAIPVPSDAQYSAPAPQHIGVAPHGETRPRRRFRREADDDQPNYAPIALLLLFVLGAIMLGIVVLLLTGNGGGPLPTKTVPAIAGESPSPSALPTFVQETPVPTLSPTVAPTETPPPITPTPPPTVPWSIGLQASTLAAFNGDEVTFTAFANQDVAGSGLVIQIFNPDTGVIHVSCVSGAQCSVAGRRQDITVRYQARVSAPDGSNVQAVSDALTVTWTPAPVTPVPVTPAPTTPAPITPAPATWSVSIAADQTNVPNLTLVTITATASQDVAGTGFVIQIFNPDTGFIHRSCTSGATCQVSGRRHDITVRYQARISFTDGSNVQAQSDPVTVTWQ